MLYETTNLNIYMLLHEMGYMRPEQIHRFFRDTADAKNIAYYLKSQIDKRNFFFASTALGPPIDPEAAITRPNSFVATHSNILMFRKAPNVNIEVLRLRLRALWVLASFNSKEVVQAFIANYPSQIMFITTDSQCYDVTVCDNTLVAQTAMINRARLIPKGAPDEINHIALVNSPELGKKLEPYGFDSYCYLDKRFVPQYGVWD